MTRQTLLQRQKKIRDYWKGSKGSPDVYDEIGEVFNKTVLEGAKTEQEFYDNLLRNLGKAHENIAWIEKAGTSPQEISNIYDLMELTQHRPTLKVLDLDGGSMRNKFKGYFQKHIKIDQDWDGLKHKLDKKVLNHDKRFKWAMKWGEDINADSLLKEVKRTEEDYKYRQRSIFIDELIKNSGGVIELTGGGNLRTPAKKVSKLNELADLIEDPEVRKEVAAGRAEKLMKDAAELLEEGAVENIFEGIRAAPTQKEKLIKKLLKDKASKKSLRRAVRAQKKGMKVFESTAKKTGRKYAKTYNPWTPGEIEELMPYIERGLKKKRNSREIAEAYMKKIKTDREIDSIKRKISRIIER